MMHTIKFYAFRGWFEMCIDTHEKLLELSMFYQVPTNMLFICSPEWWQVKVSHSQCGCEYTRFWSET